jgi:hypothetical protein
MIIRFPKYVSKVDKTLWVNHSSYYSLQSRNSLSVQRRGDFPIVGRSLREIVNAFHHPFTATGFQNRHLPTISVLKYSDRFRTSNLQSFCSVKLLICKKWSRKHLGVSIHALIVRLQIFSLHSIKFEQWRAESV